jgi:hypothetical protein
MQDDEVHPNYPVATVGWVSLLMRHGFQAIEVVLDPLSWRQTTDAVGQTKRPSFHVK